MISNTATPNTSNRSSSDIDEADLLRLLMLLWSRKILIGGLILLGCLIGVQVALSKTSVYRADALIQLEKKQSGISLSQDISDLMSNESEAVTEIEIMKSRMVLGKTVTELQLDIVATPKSSALLINLLSSTGLQLPDWEWLSPVAHHRDRLQVELFEVSNRLLGKSLVVKAMADGKYQVVAPNGTILEGSVGNILDHPDGDYRINISNIFARPGVEFLVRKEPELNALNRLRSALNVTEKGRQSSLLVVTLEGRDPHQTRKTLDQILNVYVSQNISRGSEEAEKSIDFLRKQLPLVQEEVATAENELNSFRLKHESINLDLETASILERMVAIDTQISELSLQEVELSRHYTKAHPRYASLMSKMTKLKTEKESLSSIVQSFPETQQEILKRTRNLEVSQHIYMQLLNKKQELNVLKASAVGSVRIIDNAILPPAPISQNRLMIVVKLGFLAMVFGCSVVLLRFFLERNVDSPDDIAKLGLPVYATVPRSKSEEDCAKNQNILSRDNPTELAVEALRSLRTSLHFGMLESGKGAVMITGPVPGIGKSFVASNLAYLAAESGSRVLLIDADMRRGTMARTFGIEKNAGGLSELLAGTIKLEQAIRPVALRASAAKAHVSNLQEQRSLEPELEVVLEGIDLLETDNEQKQSSMGQVGRLAVIPKGKVPPNPSELLMQDRLPNLLREASQSFDLVIVDTPPILAVTDAMIIGRYTDMNLMVVRHNQTSVREMEEVVKCFSVNSVELSGAVLNSYDQKSGRYGQYGYTYGYQYQYQSVD